MSYRGTEERHRSSSGASSTSSTTISEDEADVQLDVKVPCVRLIYRGILANSLHWSLRRNILYLHLFDRLYLFFLARRRGQTGGFIRSTRIIFSFPQNDWREAEIVGVLVEIRRTRSSQQRLMQAVQLVTLEMKSRRLNVLSGAGKDYSGRLQRAFAVAQAKTEPHHCGHCLRERCKRKFSRCEESLDELRAWLQHVQPWEGPQLPPPLPRARKRRG